MGDGMKNFDGNIKLNEKQMQEFLPDYVFGRLNESDKTNFEQNLPNFPEIQKEIKEVQAVFGKLNSMDIEKPIRERSRNLSVKVNEKINNNKSKVYSGFLSPRFAMPIMALLIGGLMIVYYGNQKNEMDNMKTDIQILTEKDIETIHNQEEELTLIQESAELAFEENTSDYSDMVQFEDEIEQIANSVISKIALKETKEISIYFSKYNFLDPTILDDLDNLDEEEFQKLYEELKNEDINS